MKPLKKVPVKLIWAQIIAVVLWFLITVIEWSQNPKSNPGFLIPAVIRGTEALSIFLVTGGLIFILENIKTSIKTMWKILALLLILYPAAILANLMSLGLRSIIGYMPPPLGSYFFFHTFHFYLPMWLVVVVYAIARGQMEISRERENKLKAENLAQQARWMMLRYQVNPHFLFNALNSVRALIGEDDDKARRVVSELSEYFRYSLTRDNAALVSMEQEINAVKSYLEIQKIRFASRLNVELNIIPGSLDFAVPVFAIQTLVENAIKHGLKTSDEVLHLSVSSNVSEDKLQISVVNTGRLAKEEGSLTNGENSGTGLENLRERLAYLDPDSHFSLDEEEGKVCARLYLTKKKLSNEDLEGPDH